jgi:DNA-binding IclR family transcriptional regulator
MANDRNQILTILESKRGEWLTAKDIMSLLGMEYNTNFHSMLNTLVRQNKIKKKVIGPYNNYTILDSKILRQP